MIDIRDIIQTELEKISLKSKDGVLERPKNLKNGDFSFFVKDTLVDFGNLSVEKINHEYVEKVEVVGKFINFHLSKKYFADSLREIVGNPKDVGKNNSLAGQNIIIEYTDPNPFKQFHIGHLMSNAIGESVSRIIEWSGATVTRTNYQGDVGPHVAKAIWGMKKLRVAPKSTPSLILKKLTRFFGSSSGHDDDVLKLGESYVLGSNSYEENPEIKKEIDLINKKVYEKTDPEINALYVWGRRISLEHFEEIYKKLGTKFSLYFFESETAPLGLFIVDELLKKGILEKSDGAIVFRGEEYGLHTRVFVNSQGLPTYETKELGLSKMKFDRQDFDQSIVVTANEQSDYFAVMLKVLEFADHRAANRTRHVSHGMMRFADGKMSSRKGNIITGESLICDVEKLVQEKIKDRKLSNEEKNSVAEKVAIGAIKYSILKQSPGKDIVFDFAKSLSFEGDSGPYLQYTCARIHSLLRKAAEAGIKEGLDNPETPGELEQLLVRLPETVERAKNEFAPQLIATYLINVASAFNHYYADHVIVDKNASESAYRIGLTRSVKNVLENGLYLLGITAPESM